MIPPLGLLSRYHYTTILCSIVYPFSTMLCTTCAYMFCPQCPCVHLSANVHFVVIHSLGGFSPFPTVYICSVSSARVRSCTLAVIADNLGLNQRKSFLFFLYLFGLGRYASALFAVTSPPPPGCPLIVAVALVARVHVFTRASSSAELIFSKVNPTSEPFFSRRVPLPPPCRAVYIACVG